MSAALSPDASLYAALCAEPAAAAGPSPMELVQELSAATRGFGHALSEAGHLLAELGEEMSPRLRYKLNGLLATVEQRAARQQAAAGALALYLARTMR
jgi:hypothetical protein